MQEKDSPHRRQYVVVAKVVVATLAMAVAVVAVAVQVQHRKIGTDLRR